VGDVATMQQVITETNRVIGGIEPDQLTNSTPCPDWDVRALLNHVTAGADMFADCVRDGSISDDRLVELMTTDRVGDDYRSSFAAAAQRALDAFAVPATRA
jgi:uncharacterized protein (TIGR03086 family)